MKRKPVKTKRLTIRPLKLNDYKTWYDEHTQCLPKQNKWDYGPIPAAKCTRLIYVRLLKKYQKLADTDDYYFYGIFENKTGQFIGHLDFDIFVRKTHQFANFGYVIYNRYRGQGYGQEACSAGLKIGFQQLKLNRLEAAINLDNKKSIRLAKAIGMKKEGIKKRYWFEYGKWADQLIYVANPEDVGLKANAPYFIKT